MRWIAVVVGLACCIAVAPAQAACEQQELRGTWQLYFSIPFKNWARCELSIDGGGDVIGNCRSTTGISRQLSGHLTVAPSTCALSGHITTSATYRIVEAHVGVDGTTAAGYVDTGNGFTMVRTRRP